MKIIYLANLSFKRTSIIIFLITVQGCGIDLPWSSKKDHSGSEAAQGFDNGNVECGESSHNSNTHSIRLKNLGQMVKHLSSTFGPASLNDVSSGENLFDKYASLYPSFEGSDYSKTVADTLSNEQTSAGLIMAQAIIARNVGLVAELADDDSLYQCDSEESAALMLNRALPFRNSCANTGDPLVSELVENCKESKANAIGAIVSSLAFMIRN